MRIGCAQLNSRENRENNKRAAERAVGELADAGARLVLLPEHFAFIGPEHMKREQAQSLTEADWLPGMRTLARSHGIFIHIGSFLEKADGRIYNTGVVLDPAGEIIATYRKIHLFDVEIPGGLCYRESDLVSPGDSVVTFAIDDVTFGMATCYDLRFPELFRRLVHRGASVLLVPAAFTLQTGRDHWEILLRARAIENLCWVVGAGQWGTAPPEHLLYGRSMVVNPWGIIVAQAGDGVTTLTADLDLAELQRIRRRFPALEHRRPDLFPGN